MSTTAGPTWKTRDVPGVSFTSHDSYEWVPVTTSVTGPILSPQSVTLFVDMKVRTCPVCLNEFKSGWVGDRSLCSLRCFYTTRKVPVLNIWLRDEGICHLCEQPVSLEDASRDHLKPRSLGGKTTYKNIALAHKLCNSRRGSKPLRSSRSTNVGES